MKRRKPKGQLTPKERKAKEIELVRHGLWLDPRWPLSRIDDANLNFLLSCSDRSLGEFELRRLSEVANLRKELHAILDKIIDEMAQAGLASWFRQTDRNALKHALKNPPDLVAWAKAEIKRRGRSEEEQAEDERFPMRFPIPAPSKAALLLPYSQRNVAAGKCAVCPRPLDLNSVRYCTEHLRQAKERMRKVRGRKRDA